MTHVQIGEKEYIIIDNIENLKLWDLFDNDKKSYLLIKVEDLTKLVRRL